MRPNNRGGVRHPGLGSITLRNRKKRTDVSGWLRLGVRSLIHGHPHVRSQVFFLGSFFFELLQYIVIVV
jgi:hypothetical protein